MTGRGNRSARTPGAPERRDSGTDNPGNPQNEPSSRSTRRTPQISPQSQSSGSSTRGGTGTGDTQRSIAPPSRMQLLGVQYPVSYSFTFILTKILICIRHRHTPHLTVVDLRIHLVALALRCNLLVFLAILHLLPNQILPETLRRAVSNPPASLLVMAAKLPTVAAALLPAVVSLRAHSMTLILLSRMPIFLLLSRGLVVFALFGLAALSSMWRIQLIVLRSVMRTQSFASSIVRLAGCPFFGMVMISSLMSLNLSGPA